MNHIEFPVVSFFLIPLLLCSLPSHIRAGSISLISLCAWLLAANLIHGINSIVWAGNVFIKVPVWCDITTKILVGFTFGVPLSVLCISRQLERISSGRQAIFTQSDKRRRIQTEIILCFVVPVFFMALHYVFQGHRFDIIEDIGCNPATYISIPTLICITGPPVLISVISMMYSLAAVHHFLKRRIEFASLLRSSNSAMTPSRYFRLLLFALSDIFFHTAATSTILFFDIRNGILPYVSWEFVHFDFSRIGLFPTILIPSTLYQELLFAWWVPPAGSFLYFILFSFGQEAISDYVAVWKWIKKIFCFCRGPILPLHVRSTFSRHISLKSRASDSFTTVQKPWEEDSSFKRVALTDAPEPSSAIDTLDELTPTISDVSDVAAPLPVHFPARLPSRTRPFSVYTV